MHNASACVSIRQHTSAHVSIRMSSRQRAYIAVRATWRSLPDLPRSSTRCARPCACSPAASNRRTCSIRQHTSAYVSICAYSPAAPNRRTSAAMNSTKRPYLPNCRQLSSSPAAYACCSVAHCSSSSSCAWPSSLLPLPLFQCVFKDVCAACA
jgi:hypothetical protein